MPRKWRAASPRWIGRRRAVLVPASLRREPSVCRRSPASACGALAWLLAGGALHAGTYVTLPARPGACVEWAARRLEAAAAARAQSGAKPQISVERADLHLPAESFTIEPSGAGLVIRGGEAVGEMYGIFELAEALEQAPAGLSWTEFLAHYQPQRQTPYLAVRADNPFIHIDRKGLLWWVQKTGAISPAAPL